MKKSIVYAGLSACLFVATPASAVVTVCDTPGCAPVDENVLIVKEIGPVIIGITNNTHAGVLFTSPLGDNLQGDAGGQADVSAQDGLLNSLKFSLANGNTFGAADFNLFPLAGNVANEATSVILTWLTTTGTASQAFALNTNGQNFGGIFGTTERFISLQFVANPTSTGWQDLRQLRLGDVRGPGGGTPTPFTTVPEPATWLMSFLGFGLIGGFMRRSRRVQAGERVRFA